MGADAICWKCRNFLYVQQWRLCGKIELPAFIQDIRDAIDYAIGVKIQNGVQDGSPTDIRAFS